MVYHTKKKEPEGPLLSISISNIIIHNHSACPCAQHESDWFVDVRCLVVLCHCRLADLGLCFHGNFV